MDRFSMFFSELNGILYFRADDGIHGDELYQYDLTTGQKSLVANVRPFKALETTVVEGVY